jgi:DNA repair exonuclease SbcCD nuclease subunit
MPLWFANHRGIFIGQAMRILFTADIHIKLGQKNVPVDWARARYTELFSQLKTMQSQCDLFVIGGDIFDRLATMEELEIYFQFLDTIIVDTIIYAGNHEAAKKNTTWLSNLKNISTKANPLVRVIDDFYTHKEVDFVPYNKLKELENTVYSFSENVLCTHVRGEIPPHVKPEVDLNLFNRWRTVLAGDLHSYENSQRNILYPGSPVTTSFHRNLASSGVIFLDTNTHEHDWVELNLPQLIRKKIQAGEPMVATDYHHTIYEVEGDMAQLGETASSELLDKKIVRRGTDTELILDPAMTLRQEVNEYLSYVLELPESQVETVLQELDNHAVRF